jgi:peptide chain release factor 3
LFNDRLLLVARSKQRREEGGIVCEGLSDPKLDELLPERAVKQLRNEVEMARGLCPEFNLEAYRQGHMTPFYFGSALNSFGVRELLAGLGKLAPPPRAQKARERVVDSGEKAVTGFVFKVQANMDPKHRDRIAFVRLCSGHFRRGQKMLHVRSGTTFSIHNPVLFLAQDRALAEEAYAGDIIGVPNHGKLRIGDTLTEGEALNYVGIPSFAPELLQRVRANDPMRAKHLGRALEQIAEEGAARVFKPRVGGNFIVGVVGALQFDVLADRIRTEYNIPVLFESSGLYTARWVEADDHDLMKKFASENAGYLSDDHTGAPVFLARNAWHLETTQKEWPGLTFLKTKEQH